MPAILNVWFGGSEAAYAIGDALFGYVNPGGKLTMTFPKNVGQIPLYYAHKNTGRPLGQGKWFEKFRSNYLDVDNEPLYPFGYGLSYTTFSYSDIDLSHSSMDMNGSLTAAVTVTNTGTWPGSEVVQLYIRDASFPSFGEGGVAESRGGRWMHNADNNRLTHSPTTSPYGYSSFPKEEN